MIWVGQRTIDCARHAEPARVLPVRIAAGAFGPGLPCRDLDLSPEHSVFVRGVLIPVVDLANGDTVRQITVPTVTYHHVELDSHDIMLAESLPAESFLENGNRHDFKGESPMSLHATLRGSEGGMPCARIVRQGPVVEEVRQMLARQAALVRRAA